VQPKDNHGQTRANGQGRSVEISLSQRERLSSTLVNEHMKRESSHDRQGREGILKLIGRIAQFIEPSLKEQRGQPADSKHIMFVAHGIFNSELVGALLSRVKGQVVRGHYRGESLVSQDCETH
jgi:broad specificity phosphatase PhoE